jgi:hypothetical protein
VVLFLGALVRVVAALFVVLGRRRDSLDAVLLMIIVLMFCIANISEGSILSRDNLRWMVFTMTATKLSSLGRILWQDRQRALQQRSPRALGSGGNTE